LPDEWNDWQTAELGKAWECLFDYNIGPRYGIKGELMHISKTPWNLSGYLMARGEENVGCSSLEERPIEITEENDGSSSQQESRPMEIAEDDNNSSQQESRSMEIAENDDNSSR